MEMDTNDLGEYFSLLSFAGQQLEAWTRGDLPQNLEAKWQDYREEGLIERTKDCKKVVRVDPEADAILYLTQEGREILEDNIYRDGQNMTYSDIREELRGDNYDPLEGVEQ